MDQFTRIRTFIKVVEAGSFSAAARDVSSTSSVARQVNALEDELGVRLLQRSTRSLALTGAGRRLYERATAIATELDQAKAEARSLHDDVKGRLRVQLRVATGTTVVVPALPRLLEQHPELSLDISLSDERRDLIANDIDVAVWLGDLPDSEIVARRLSPNRRIVCGSRAYLDKHGVPSAPEDLRHHNCLVFSASPSCERWTFTRAGEQVDVDVRGSVSSDNSIVLLSSGMADLGLVIVQQWMVRQFVAEGRMRRVLGDWAVSPRPGDAALYAMFPSSRGASRKVRVFVDFLVELFGVEAGDA